MAVLIVTLERDRPYRPPREGGSGAPEKRTGLADLRRVVRSRYAWHLGFIYLLFAFAYLTYYTFFQKRLIADLGLSSGTAGTLFMIARVASLVCAMFWGVASDRFGRGRALAAVFAAQAIAACLFAIRPNMATLVISAVIFGSAVFSVSGLIAAACGDRFGARLAFASMGFVTIFIGTGQAVGPYVGGLLEDVFGSLGPSYLLCAFVFVVGAVASFLLPDARPTRSTPPGGQAATDITPGVGLGAPLDEA